MSAENHHRHESRVAAWLRLICWSAGFVGCLSSRAWRRVVCVFPGSDGGVFPFINRALFLIRLSICGQNSQKIFADVIFPCSLFWSLFPFSGDRISQKPRNERVRGEEKQDTVELGMRRRESTAQYTTPPSVSPHWNRTGALSRRGRQ